MTCKDCVHYEMCKEWCSGIDEYIDPKGKENQEPCEHYKDKTRFVELPCTVGDRLYYANKTLTEVCEATIIKIEINYFTSPQIWFTIDYISSIVGKCRHRGKADLMLNKTLFFTYEEAEKALKGAENE